MSVSGAWLLALALTETSAPPQQQPASPLIDALARCLTMTNDAERLRCSDVAARRLVEASRAREVVVVDQEEVKSTRRSLFGFQLPRVGLFGSGGPDQGGDVERLETRIIGVSQLGYGKYAITVEGGARWSTTEAWSGAPYPTVGATTTLRKGTMGGYFLKIGNARAVRAMRTG